MAKKRRILLGFIMLVALFATSSMLVSCEKNVYPNTINIKEFPQYSNFEWNIIEIMIYWDNDNGGYITKNITDTSIINNIWDILCNEVVFEYIGKDTFDGGHSYLEFKLEASQKVEVYLFPIQYGSDQVYYKYNSDIFQNLIKEIVHNQ